MRVLWNVLAPLAALIGFLGAAEAQVTLKVVPHSDLKIADPIWTTAYISRNHGYMIYDTLFAMDEQGEIKPQMVEKHEVSADRPGAARARQAVLECSIHDAQARCRDRPQHADLGLHGIGALRVQA